ncbi:unnamed protein product, partial [Mesorhabditis belari]|uniref:Spindle assembly checkpoint component MAD1 n=1 Tax=Mesorhabditis belari TaxID=2138241 RepID=A0AAF3F046_9BILA
MDGERKHFEQIFRTPRQGLALTNRYSQSSSSLPSSNFADINTRLFKAETSATNAKLYEATEENRLLSKQIEEQKRLILDLQKDNKDHVRKQEDMVNEIANLKKEVSRGTRNLEEAMNESATISTNVEAELSCLRKVANKLYNHHLKDRAQLQCVKNLLLQNTLWTAKNLLEIRSSYLGVPISKLDDEKISEWYRGSEMDYTGIDETEPPQVVPSPEFVFNNDEETADLTTGLRFQRKVINDTMQLARKRSGSGPRRILSPIPSESSLTDMSTTQQDITEASVCDQTMNSVDYENYEKIQKLEADTSQLRQQLFVAQSHANNALLYCHQKLDFEKKYNFTNKKLEETMKELCAIRNATARNLFGSEDGRSQVDKIVAMNQRIEELDNEVKKLRDKLAESERNTEKAHSMLKDERMTSDSLRTNWDEHMTYCESKIDELQIKFNMANEQVDDLRKKLANQDTTIQELQRKVTTHSEPTDAGDTTQIFHVRMNPLEMAHLQFKQKEEEEEERDRKRKLVPDAGPSEDHEELEAKRAKINERVTVLEEQLRRAEQSKAKAVEIQGNLARRYREVSTALTGYQIKMRDEECHVVSCVGVEPEDAFTFKYEDGNLMLIARDDGSSEISSQKWRKEMDQYLGEWKSVPAFLSQVTISLTETLHEEHTFTQPSYSVIHDD